MKKIIFYTILFLSLTSTLFAIDEDTYVQFAAHSTIIAYKVKGNFNARDLWADEMKMKYPDFMNQDWQSFEEKMAKDNALKNRVCNKILENIKAKGYDAHILNLGGGNTTIEIED